MGANLLPQALFDYLVAHQPEPDTVQWLRRETEQLPDSMMLTSPDQSAFFTMLIQLANVKTVLEVGTFSGLSALNMALAVGDAGHITTIDRYDNAYTALARHAWDTAEVTDRITFIHDRAVPALEALSRTHQEVFDLIFLDALKAEYMDFYKLSLPLLKPGGILIADNIFMSGMVADPTITKKSVQCVRDFTDFIVTTPEVSTTLLPIGDGMSLSIKR